MNVKRTSIQTRVISMLLVLCMVLGMVPATALEVFAADTTYVYNPTAGETNSIYTVNGTVKADRNDFEYNSVPLTDAVEMGSSAYVTFTAPADGTLTVCAETGTAGRALGLFAGDDEVATWTLDTTKTLLTFTAEVTAGTEYTIKRSSNTTYLYYVCLTVSDSGSGDSGNTGGSGTTTGNTYIYNPTADETNNIYTVNGTVKADRNDFEYNSVPLTDAVEMGSSAYVTFTAPADGTLTVCAETGTAGRALGLFVGDDEVATWTLDTTKTLLTFTAEVTAGTEYTIKRSSNTTYLYYVSLTTSGSSTETTAHTHSYSKVDSECVAPTCGEDGYDFYECACGDYYMEPIAATGNHNYIVKSTTNATCTEQGYITYECSTCGDTYNDGYNGPNGHNYVDGKCSTCGAADPNGSTEWKVDCSAGWWSAHSEVFEITTTPKTWTFTATTDSDAVNVYDSAVVAIWREDTATVNGSSNYIEELIARADNFAVSEEFPWGSEQHDVGESGSWSDTWLEDLKAGAECSVTAQLYGDNILLSFTVNGLTNVYSVPKNTSSSSPVYMTLTGENVVLTGLEESSNHADFSDAAKNHTNVFVESIVTEAGCETAGEKKFTCSCGDYYTETIAATGHNYVNGTCQNCGEAEAAYDSATGTATVVTGGSGSSSEFNLATSMTDGAAYILSNSSNKDRAAYWKSDAWTTGTITATAVSGKDNTYTITSSTGYSTWTWEVKDSSNPNVGYFKNNDTGKYINFADGNFEVTASSTSDAALFTVDISAKTIKDSDGNYMKVGSKTLEDNTSAQTSMILYTPAVTTTTTTYNVTLTADQASLALQVGGSNGTVSGTVTAANAETGAAGYVNGKTITWKSSNTSVVTVASNGTVTVVGEGTATITGTLTGVTIDGTAASSVSSGITVDIPVTVEAPEEWTDTWETVTTNEVTLGGSGSVTFTLSGTVPANAWGHIDNVKLYKEGSSTPVWTDDFDDFNTVGWALTALNYVSYDNTAANNKTGRLDLWLNADNATAASASYTVSGLAAGDYYFTYDIIGNSTLTGAASAAENQGKVYEHNFNTDGTTVEDADKDVFTIAGSTTTSHGSGSVSVDGESMTFNTTALKLNSAGSFTVNAVADGKLTLVFSSKTSGRGITVNDAEYDITGASELTSVTIDVEAGKTYTITNNDGEGGLYYVKYETTGAAAEKTITGSTLSMTSVTVDSGATTVPEGKLSTLTMTVTYSDGSTEVISNDKLTIDYDIEETSSGKKIDVAYKVDGVTLAQNTIAVIESAASTSSSEWTHNFTDDSNSSSKYTFAGTLETTGKYGSYTYGAETLHDSLKMDSSGKITFTTPNDGKTHTLTLCAATANSSGATLNISGGDLDLDLAMSSAQSLNTYTVDLEPNTSYTIQRTKNESGIFFLDLVAEGSGSGAATMTVYTLDTDGLDTGKGYIIVAQDSDGKYYALSHDGTAEKAVEVTLSSDGKIVNISDTDATNALWSFATTDDGYSASNKGEDTTVYLRTGSATVVDDTKYSNITVTHNGSGKYVINMGGKDLVVSGADFQRGSADLTNVVGLYYKATVAANSVSVSNVPALQLGTYPTTKLVPTVIFGGQTTTSYQISWNSDNTNVATVASDGTVTAKAVGSANITGTVTYSDGTTAVVTVPITVSAPYLDLGEDITMYVGDEGHFIPDVYVHSEVDAYTLTWTTTDGTVASVDNGKVNALANGTVTLTATLATVTVDGVTTDVSALGYSDSVTVTVNTNVIAAGKLNTDTLTVIADDDGNVSVDTIQEALDTVALNLTWTNGTTQTVDVTFDKTADQITFGEDGTAVVNVTYTNGDYTFNGSVTINKLSKEAASADGVIYAGDSEYVLDTDGIDAGEEYLIVWNDDGTYYALVNPDEDDGGSKGSAQKVTVSGDKATISSDYADLAVWTFANKSTSGDHEGYKIYNTERYFRVDNNSFLSGASNATVVYVYDEGDGEYRIALTVDTGDDVNDDLSTRDLIYDGSWQREGSADTTADCVLLYKKITGSSETKTVNFEVMLDATADADGVYKVATGNYIDVESILAQVNGVATDNYTVEWTVVDKDGDTVDSDVFAASNDRLTGLKAGDYTVTATLTKVDGATPMNNATNTAGIPVSFNISVIDETVTYDLQNNVIRLPLNGDLDMSGVSLKLDYDISSDLVVKSTGLVFDLVGAVEENGLSTSVPGTYYVDVYFNGTKLDEQVQIVVGGSIWDNRDMANSYPGYPDAGAVRMDKTAEGIDWYNTGVAQVELNAAGISTKDAVDVVLVVDVSNSMAWTDYWFNNYDGDAPADVDKVPYNDNGEADASLEDKLDQAMAAASNFADTLLSGYIAGSDKNNTISFVTFAGNDEDYGGNGTDIDSVMTVFTGVEKAADAKKSFANTKFTEVTVGEKNDKGNYPVSYTLKIADTDGDKIVEGTNRGNTNYDWAFAEAQRAVDKLKSDYKSENGKSYDESGRELHVVFMTDGAPSHYNGMHYAGSNEGDRYEKFSGSASEWLAHAQEPNTLATELYAEITDMHIVGYDLNHGGFGSYSWTENELGRVLYGIVESNYLPYTLASDTAKLNQFFDELGKSLSYAGTNAYVTDTIGDAFSLHTTGVNTDAVVTETPIQYVSRRLVVASDIGTTLKINGVDTYIEQKHLGEYVDGTESVIEEITFGSGSTAYSSLLGEGDDIWDESKGIIQGKYVTVDLNAKEITWQIGDVTEYEYALTYYAYLTGSMEGTRDDGMYPTNKEATLTYIDVNGDIAEREYPVPEMPWGTGSVTVRFYLVNEDGKYANEAGETFDNQANRLFLTNTANYPLNYNGQIAVGGKDGTTTSEGISVLNAFNDAGLNSGSNAGMYELFDETIQVTVKSHSGGDGTYGETSEKTGTNSQGESLKTLSLTLTEVMDMLNDGTYTIVNINIPVIKTGRSMTQTPLIPEYIVLDYGKEIQQSVFNGNETAITNYGYSMEVYGFHPYDSGFSTNWYLDKSKGEFGEELAEGEPYTVNGVGTFTIVDKETGIIKFNPTAIMTGVEQIFAVIKINKLDNGAATNQNYYLYNPITVVPATTVYYETDFASGVFGLTGSWTNDTTDIRTQDSDPDIIRRDDEVNGTAHAVDNYGFDSSYTTGNALSGGSAMLAAGEGPSKTKTTFSFTGTGLDIISKTGVNEGTIRARVYNSSGALVKTVSVINKGATELNQIPVINIRDLAYGSYTVEIGVYAPVTYGGDRSHLDRGNSFYFDAIRVYGTCDGGEDAETALTEYKLDGEANPEIEEIRDLILTAQEFSDGVTTGIIYIDGKGSQTVSDYDLVGPNNELYLLSGNKIAFTLKVKDNAPATVALAAKSVDGSDAKLKVTIVDSSATVVVDGAEIKSATAQYYELLNGVNGSVFTDGATVIIENTGSGKLSLTDLKVAFSGNGSTVEITSDQQTEKIVIAVQDTSCKVESAVFTSTDFRVMRTATMTVVTSSNVESLKLADANGNVVWSSATCYVNGDTKVWTVKMRPVLLGWQTYTVVAFNANGEQGTNISNTINVAN